MPARAFRTGTADPGLQAGSADILVPTSRRGQALFSNIGANNNTADGFQALHTNTTGNSNTGIGFGALETSTTGNGNTAIGANALSNTTGSGNIALGLAAGTGVLAGDNNPGVKAGHFPLQERQDRHIPVWFDRRRSR